jgi:hypothetical protein
MPNNIAESAKYNENMRRFAKEIVSLVRIDALLDTLWSPFFLQWRRVDSVDFRIRM